MPNINVIRRVVLQPKPVAPVGGGAYVGPGDISAAFMWGGLRAYAAAAIGSNAVRLVRASDSAQQDFVTLSDGKLDIASITTFLAATTGKVVTLYDQTGNGRHLTQATDSKRPAFVFNAIGGRPTMRFLIANQTVLTSAGLSGSAPMTHSFVLSRTATANMGLSWWGSSPAPTFMDFTAANTLRVACSTNFTYASFTNNQFQAVQGVFNGVSSALNINGSNVATGSLSNPAPSTNAILLGDNAFNSFFTGDICEFGIFLAAGVAIGSNQQAYWGY